ncbi:unnamed protein product [Onchocerca flexuosa]|uniref:HotDog ACOT-type domain-containing protein n=1 Tax=Onchocerca flexuosa TaxID=387005 RepID=A0A183H2I3_9BILA|nr:unnamed protein product [Onchocerca flexuosa]
MKLYGDFFLSFPIHERSLAVVHLAVHLKNGQSVYFTAVNVQHIAPNPPATTLTAFFTFYQTDAFAKTLLYSEMPIIANRMRVENHLNNTKEENQLTDNLAYSKKL